MLVRVCCECRKEIGTTESSEAARTHGYCPACYKAMLAKMRAMGIDTSGMENDDDDA